jgi:hypothetical protein
MKKHLTFSLALLTFICSTITAQLPSYLPADGLVGWWPFNGNANDESGNGNDGVVNGATLIEDRNGAVNAAYSFNGTSNYISVPHSDNFNMLQATWLVWVNIPVSSGGLGSYIMGKRDNSQHHVTFAEYLGYPQSQIGWASNQGVGVSSGNLADGNWHLLAITYDQLLSTNNYIFYFDGQQGTTSTIQQFTFVNGDLRFGLEANNFYWQPLNGRLDDAVIYNRVLTQQEISSIYAESITNDGDNSSINLIPQGIPYQAAARDAQGQVIADAPVSVRFSLHEGAVDGVVSYSETHALTTNSIGLFNTVLGNGTPEQSAFDSINWAATTKFLQVEIDLGDGYVDMGTTQLLSVPYAFRSDEAARIKNAGLPIFADNAAALAGGLVAGEMYRTAVGDLKVVY